MTFQKAGKTLRLKERGLHGEGKLIRKCNGDSCCAKDPNGRYWVLPCGHHAAHIHCSCKLRDKKCLGCKRVFVAAAKYKVPGKRYGRNTMLTIEDWYEVEDPHDRTPKGGTDAK